MKMKIIACTCLLLFVSQVACASDAVRRRGCRVGIEHGEFMARRAQVLGNVKKQTPYLGERHQLVVLASFQDKDFINGPAAAMEEWDKIFNTENYREGRYVGSVHDYFMAQSYGQFSLRFDLMFVELPDGLEKYRSNDYDDENSQYLVDDIVDVLATKDIDWSQYDWDGDDFVDQLMIIYAGKGQNDDGGSNTIWPHQLWLSLHSNLETEDPTDYRSYRDVTSGEKVYHVDCYCCIQELSSQSETNSPFGTICHEYSHCFGLPDFYFNNSVVWDWDLMDSGNYLGGGFHPCSYSAHERMLMGWLEPIELSSPTHIDDIPALEDEPTAYLIRNDGAENEYYIVENRQRKGWDELLPGSGIVVFHVDYDPMVWVSINEWPNNGSKKRYHIFAANNISRKTGKKDWAYPYVVKDETGYEVVENDSLTDTSKPAAILNNTNANGSLLMSKPITRMTVDDGGRASFVFMGEEMNRVEDVKEMKDGAIYTISGIRLNTMPQKGFYIRDGKKFGLFQ